MAKWSQWTKIASGPYQGTPQLTMMGLGASGYATMVQERTGNVVQHTPAMPDAPAAVVKMGGAGTIAHLPQGPGRLGGAWATGSDKRLYHIDWEGPQRRWQKTEGPGQFLGAVWSSTSFDGSAEILGEGVDHQLAFAYLAPGQNRDRIDRWENLGQPGEAGARKGLNGRPAAVYTAHGLHVLVRGQDNHLWHLHSQDDPARQKRTFSRWTNLGGGLSQVPVAVRTQQGIDCFVIGANNEPFVNSWDGARWSGFKSLGGQLSGLPVGVHLYGSGRTYVFGRGVHDHLWYSQRNGAGWQAWESVGDGLSGDPALWDESVSEQGAGELSCVVLRQNGELWQRQLHLSPKEYSGAQ